MLFTNVYLRHILTLMWKGTAYMLLGGKVLTYVSCNYSIAFVILC